MPRSLLAFLLISCSVVLARDSVAQSYIGYFEVPIEWVLHDMEYHDGYLWVIHRSDETPRILQMNPDTGDLVGTIDLNVEFRPAGIAWDGEHFWISSWEPGVPGRLYKISADGNVLHEIPAPNTTSPAGLAWHAGDFWVSRSQPSAAAAHVRVDPEDGAELEVIPAPWAQPAGMAFLGDVTFWSTNTGIGTSPEKLYHLDRMTGELLFDMDMPDGIGRPRGLAWDGEQYLFMVAHTRPGPVHYRIYTIDLLSDGAPVLSYAPSPLEFGLVVTNAPETQEITLFNAGEGDLVVEDVELAGSISFSTTFQGAVVAPNAEVAVPVAFDPDAYGPENATLTFSTNDVDHLEVEIEIHGHGLYPEQTVATLTNSHDFGSVRIEDPYSRAIRTWPLAVVNEGAATLTISNVAVEAPFSVEDDPGFPLEIAGADTTHITIGFRPTELGTFTADVVISTDDAQQPTVLVEVVGQGIDPEVNGGTPLWTLAIPDNPATGFQNRKIHAIRPLDDVTGDGTPNLVIGTRNYWVMGIRGNSWQTGEILWSFNTCPHSDNCGSVSGVDGLYHTGMVTGVDLNGDGFGDVIVGTGGGNDHVYALSGADGSVIWAHGDEDDPFLGSYNAVDARFDFDGDGVPDVAAGTSSAGGGSPNPYNERRVFLLSGATGETIWVRRPNHQVPVSAVAQLMGSDGAPRVVAGGHNPAAGQGGVVAYDEAGNMLWNHPVSFSPYLFLPLSRPNEDGEDVIFAGAGTNSALVKLNGDSGGVLWSVPGMSTVWKIELVGDVSGSGVDDVVVGDFNGNVSVYDGLNGAQVWTVTLPAQAFSVAAVGDVTLDGISEIAVGTANSEVRLLSGADGQTLWTYHAGNGTIQQAADEVVVLPDVDGNNAPEIAVGARHGQLTLLKSTGEVLPVSGETEVKAATLALYPPFPNPARTEVTFPFSLTEAAQVSISVYDLLGRQVARVVDAEWPAGAHEVTWSGRTRSGAAVAAGLYVVRLESQDHVSTQRVVIMP